MDRKHMESVDMLRRYWKSDLLIFVFRVGAGDNSTSRVHLQFLPIADIFLMISVLSIGGLLHVY